MASVKSSTALRRSPAARWAMPRRCGPTQLRIECRGAVGVGDGARVIFLIEARESALSQRQGIARLQLGDTAEVSDGRVRDGFRYIGPPARPVGFSKIRLQIDRPIEIEDGLIVAGGPHPGAFQKRQKLRARCAGRSCAYKPRRLRRSPAERRPATLAACGAWLAPRPPPSPGSAPEHFRAVGRQGLARSRFDFRIVHCTPMIKEHETGASDYRWRVSGQSCWTGRLSLYLTLRDTYSRSVRLRSNALPTIAWS